MKPDISVENIFLRSTFNARCSIQVLVVTVVDMLNVNTAEKQVFRFVSQRNINNCQYFFSAWITRFESDTIPETQNCKWEINKRTWCYKLYELRDIVS